MNIISLIVLSLLIVSSLQQDKPWMNTNLTPEQRTQQLLAKMTNDNKFFMLHGKDCYPYVGRVPAQPDLGIPEIRLEDGPQGVADGAKPVTAFPGALTVAATFDPSSAYEFGKAMAIEQKIKGSNVLLGPMMNIARIPQGGRNFESLGEDTFLAGEIAYSIIKGIQDQGIIACAKHWAMNNQEYNRTTTSANIDERTMWEIYFPHFQRSVEAGVGSFMCSYNKVNNTWTCENDYLNNYALKGKMNFTGWIMSDWGATHSAANAANAGLDQQMPDDYWFGQRLQDDFKAGKISQSRIDNMVYRILLPMFQMGIFDRPQTGDIKADSRSPYSTLTARQLSANSTVLLKNTQSLLPLDLTKIKSIALLGDGAQDKVIFAGDGSGHVEGEPVITPLSALQAALQGKGITVNYATNGQLDKALQYAQQSDIAIVFAGCKSSEGGDRGDLGLGNNQDSFIAQISQVQKRKQTIVVLDIPGAITMPWVDQVQAILCQFMPGQEIGNSFVDIVLGKVNPSGRLPVTFPINEKQVPASTQDQYPGINDEASYSEKWFVGYRWYDQNQQNPLFYFGYGLSYTTFAYQNFSVQGSKIGVDTQVSLTVQNSGKMNGAEVVQLYIGMPALLNEPPKQLKGLKKIFINAQQSQTITIPITKRAFQIWNVQIADYDIVPGDYLFLIGSSSRDIKAVWQCTIDISLNISKCKSQGQQDEKLIQQ